MIPVRWRRGRSVWGADATHVDLMDAGGSLAGSGASYGGGG